MLKTLLILVLLYYSFKLIVRFLLPYFAQHWVRKAQENFQRQQGYVDPEEAKKREGEVNLKTKPKSQTAQASKKEELGDYIDFEEIKEDN